MKIPTTRGLEAAEWLASNGMRARPVRLRASDYATWQSDPFQFYLQVRLGLRSALQSEEALAYGSWMHKAHEVTCHGWDPPTRTPNDLYKQAIGERLSEIADTPGLLAQDITHAIEREEKMAREAWVWHYAAMTRPLPQRGRTRAWDLLQAQKYIGAEVLLEVDSPFGPLACEIDDLRYDPKTNELHAWDLKSTSHSVSKRLAACPFEYASHLYRYIIELDLARPVSTLRTLLGRSGFEPINAKLGSFRHLVVQKPTIRFGQNDRPFSIVSKTLKSGPRKGLTVTEKVFEGEPSYDIYLERCLDWYAGEGDFIDKAEERKTDPVVNISEVRYAGVPIEPSGEFFTQITQHQLAATGRATPEDFPRSALNYVDKSDNWLYAPFYTQPVRAWPDLMKTQNLKQSWRSPLPE